MSESEYLLFRPISKSFRTDGTAFQTYPMQYTYFHVIFKSVRQQFISNRDSKVMWKGDSKCLPLSFVGLWNSFQTILLRNQQHSVYCLSYPCHLLKHESFKAGTVNKQWSHNPRVTPSFKVKILCRRWRPRVRHGLNRYRRNSCSRRTRWWLQTDLTKRWVVE